MDRGISEALLAALRAAQHVAVFTGAGVSAESGVPTFRDALTGLWERFNAEELATAEAFQRDPDLVWGWYEWRRAKVMQAEPNSAHRAIAEMAHHVPKLSLITQNVDDLHERAGSVGPIHLHGSLQATRCLDCARPAPRTLDVPNEPEGGRRLAPPHCPQCGGAIRPGVVWFGEPLPESAWTAAVAAAEACDLLFSIGTSALVYPAAELPLRAARRGAVVVQVNPQPTGPDQLARFNLTGAAGHVMPLIVDRVWGAFGS